GSCVNPLCPPSKRLIDERATDASVGAGDQDCLVLNVHSVHLSYIALCDQNCKKHKLTSNVRSSGLIRFQKLHLCAHDPAVALCPAAHTSEWRDDCPSQFGQGILDSDGLRSRYAPVNQSFGFEIAKSSGEHTLGDTSELAAQLAVPMRPLFQRK